MDGDSNKTRQQLIEELNALRRRLAELEADCASPADPPRGSPDLSFIYDLDGRYVEVLDNQHQLVVYPEMGDLKGSLVHNVLPRDIADLLLDTIRRAVDANAIETVEYQLEVPAGVRWFEGRLSPFATGYAKPDRVMLVSRDITERKRLEIAQAQRIANLEQALRDIDPAHAALPICSFCHQVRGNKTDWQDLTHYLYTRFQIKLSHGVCPSCMTKHYPDYV